MVKTISAHDNASCLCAKTKKRWGTCNAYDAPRLFAKTPTPTSTTPVANPPQGAVSGTNAAGSTGQILSVGNQTAISTDMEEKILWGQKVYNSNGTPSNRIIGGHSPQIDNSHTKYSVEMINLNTDGTRVVKFITEFSGGTLSKIKKSTLFPASWSDSDILDAVKTVGDTNPLVMRLSDKASLHRGVVKGVDIEVIKIGNDVISAYPTGGIPTSLGKF